jgi:hypothetical protein
MTVGAEVSFSTLFTTPSNIIVRAGSEVLLVILVFRRVPK